MSKATATDNKSAASKPPTPCPYQCPFKLSGKDAEWEGMTYKTFSMKDHEMFRTLADSTDPSWKLRFDENGTFTWDKKVEGEPMRMIKVFGVLPDVPTELLYDVLQDAVYRAVWDERRLDGYRFCLLDETTEIGYYAAKIGFAMDDREFVNQRGWVNAGNGEYMIWNTSVPITRMAKETKGRTRAISKVSGYLIRRWGNGGSSITYVTQTDPRGWIPSSIINMVTTRVAPNTIQTFHAACKKYPEWVKSQGDKYTRPWLTNASPYPTPQKNNIYDFATERAKKGSGVAPPSLLPEGSDASPAVTSTPQHYWVADKTPQASPVDASGKNNSAAASNGGDEKKQQEQQEEAGGNVKKGDHVRQESIAETPKVDGKE